MPLIIKTIELENGLLRCVPDNASEASQGYSSLSYGYEQDRYHSSSMTSKTRHVDLQPDGNSFDLMSGLIKQKT